MQHLVKVGTGIVLKKGNSILLGKRHKHDIWALPGGKLDMGETILECAKREVFEETGIKVIDAKLVSVCDETNTNEYIVFGFISENFEGEARDIDGEEISNWQWFDLDNLPTPLFGPSTELLENYREGRIYKS